jgi:hypothetical protein
MPGSIVRVLATAHSVTIGGSDDLDHLAAAGTNQNVSTNERMALLTGIAATSVALFSQRRGSLSVLTVHRTDGRTNEKLLGFS